MTPMRALLFALQLTPGSFGATIPGLFMPKDELRQIRETCTTDKCWGLALALHAAMTKEPDKVDPCTNWDEFICGNFDKVKQQDMKMRSDQQEVNARTLMEDVIDGLLNDVVGNPFGGYSEQLPPQEAHEPTFNRMRRYYAKCMQHKEREHVGMEPLKRLINNVQETFGKFESQYGSKQFDPKGRIIISPESTYRDGTMNMYDREAVGNTTGHLANHKIWVLAEFMPQQSVFNSSTMRISVRPHIPQGLPRKELYQSKRLTKRYKNVVKGFLRQSWEARWPDRIWDRIAKQVVELEGKILDMLPSHENWPRRKENTVKWTSKQLEEATPDLAIHSVIADQPHRDDKVPYLDELEVMFPSYWPELQGLIRKTPRVVFRAFTVWQAFVQTYDLFDGEVPKQYRDLLRNIDGTEKETPLEVKCRKRTSKHFSPILGSFFINNTFNNDTKNLGLKIFDEIGGELVKTLNNTVWIQNDTKAAAIRKAKNVSPVIGYPDQDPDILNWGDLKSYFAGAAVTRWNRSKSWTHADDYLQMEAWYARKAWLNDLYKKPSEYDMTLNPYDVDTHYSNQKNQVIVPAGIMWEHVLDSSLPSYANYGGFGSLVGQEMFHAFGTVGSTFGADGSLSDWFSRKDQADLRGRLRCFIAAYNNINITGDDGKVYNIDGAAIVDNVMADTHGADIAYSAWKKHSQSNKDQILPGLSLYTDDQLFWMFRSLHYCSKERKQLLPHELATGNGLPKRVQTWAPLKHSFAWHQAFNCRPQGPVCRAWGKGTYASKYPKLPGEMGGNDENNNVHTQKNGPDDSYFFTVLEEGE